MAQEPSGSLNVNGEHTATLRRRQIAANTWKVWMLTVSALEFVDGVEGHRIKLSKKDALDPLDLFLDRSQVAAVEGNKIKPTQK